VGVHPEQFCRHLARPAADFDDWPLLYDVAKEIRDDPSLQLLIARPSRAEEAIVIASRTPLEEPALVVPTHRLTLPDSFACFATDLPILTPRREWRGWWNASGDHQELIGACILLGTFVRFSDQPRSFSRFIRSTGSVI
jgi:hypothetical protein